MTEIASRTSSDPWLNLQPDSPRNATAASERLIRALEAHLSAEAQDLADCEDLANRSSEPSVKLLLGLIIEDQYRHRALLGSMVQRLDGAVEVIAAPADQTRGGGSSSVTEVELAAAARTLIRNEHEAARHLRHIARQESPLYAGLYSVLLEAIARDSEKHAALLRFLLTRLERRS
jgi:hypothetical protein